MSGLLSHRSEKTPIIALSELFSLKANQRRSDTHQLHPERLS